ncbi:Xaa-Pro aminopeptidase/Xaa-Pro dipeptidase [Colwellia chukchiensis]|uniref:Xaa-Pro aminopeptidase/Xaa-Pro dipeptidase n=1 Tax=Colwellia chukchiensis TaxID=641665 RepID=A0A1H7MMP5_9GAMM|nr:Xaa-Pro peptidase family protein [Colwellia chukchiensis]SEL11887.1 Xaa-Pro aminopeptidase/Xaa-Pro dipeptidase [Colwellia chukchiensis]
MKINQLRQQVLTSGDSAMLIFSDINIRYVSGFSGHAATVLLTHEHNYLLTDYRYFEQAKAEAGQQGFTVICRDRANQSLPALITELLQQAQSQRLYFESEHISVQQWQAMSAQIMQQSQVSDTIALAGSIEKLRMIKTDTELASMKQAAAIADQALANILPLVKAGITERELAIELDYQMAKLGSEEVSFATILLFGERSALPHGIPSQRALKQGDLILIDFGAVVNGYRSDMTRTYVFGKADAKQQQIYQLVQQAQQAAIDKVSVGVTGEALYQQSANILLNSEYQAYAGEGLGHGVGLQLHEQPFLGPDCTTLIELGCVITIEPGIYIPGWGGIRIEDDVVLTEQGLEILTQTPKTLTEL